MNSPTQKAPAEQRKDEKNSSKESKSAVIHEFKGLEKPSGSMNKQIALILIIAAVLGVFTGYTLSHKGGVSQITSMNSTSDSGSNSKIEGSNDLKTFKDTAEGTLQDGGIDGEGQFHLVRPGGDSQNVYLVSSIVDLSKYVGKKIKVWGQTQASQKAGWLMDVGRVEAL